MFKKAKRKIVIAILAILCAVLVGTLGMVYISSYLSIKASNYQVLESHVQMLSDNMMRDFENNKGIGKSGEPKIQDDAAIDDNPQNQSLQGQKKVQRHLEVNTFYSVKILADGSTEVTENGAEGIHSDEELVNLALKVSSDDRGSTGQMIYIVSSLDDCTLVCFMDNIVFNDSFTRLFLFTILFGVIGIIIIFFISKRIANRIVSPMEEVYEKQKQFTADAGHELKTPVAAMAANIELLQRELGENKWLDNISYENERMRELVTELLELARNENRTVQKEITDLSHLVNGVILPLEATAFENNILIESEIPDGISANIDAKSTAQLVTILVDNAISHTHCKEGQIEKINVALSQEKGGAVLSVSNPGEEIPESERKNLFERFYRTDSAHEFTGHYGLGLAIAKAIADANGAGISVSCQDGQVTFTVRFSSK